MHASSSFGSPISGTLNIYTPQTYQVFQRSGSQGNISIVGSYNYPGTHDIEASFNGGVYATIATNTTSGSFSGTLTAQSQGQGTLTVRLKDATSISATVSLVGIGDVFIIAGQSNAAGQGTNVQSYSHASLKAALFGNDYDWRECVDPTDRNTLQEDSISDDSTASNGSVWPLVATSHMAGQSVPIAFVPCAKGSTLISQWQPGSNHQDRTTLYGSMVYRALQTGCKAVLWWQGETDAGSGTSQSTYYNSLVSLATAVNSDLGVKLMVAKLHTLTAISGTLQTPIRAGQAQAWSSNSSIVLTGPDLSGITADSADGYHLAGNTNLSSAASLWWSAMQSAFGW